MIKLAFLIVFIVLLVKIFDGGLAVKVNGKKYSMEVEQKKTVKKWYINDKLKAVREIKK